MLSKFRMQTCPCLFRNTDFIRWMLVRRILESKTKPTPSAAPTEPSKIVYLYRWTPPTRKFRSKSMHSDDNFIPLEWLFWGPACVLAKMWPSSDKFPADNAELCHLVAADGITTQFVMKLGSLHSTEL